MEKVTHYETATYRLVKTEADTKNLCTVTKTNH